MELKAKLQKPYTEAQRIDFIVVQNHRMGYEIKETDTALEAWGADDTDKLEAARANKYTENESVRDTFLVSGVEYKGVMFDSDLEQKLNILATVEGMSETDVITWVGMDGVTSLECTKEDLTNIGALLTAMTTYVWQIRNPEIKKAIQEAKTMEELDAIEISYSLEEMTAKTQQAETEEAEK